MLNFLFCFQAKEILKKGVKLVKTFLFILLSMLTTVPQTGDTTMILCIVGGGALVLVILFIWISKRRR